MKRIALVAALLAAPVSAHADILSNVFSEGPYVQKMHISARLHPPGRFIHRRIASERGAGGFVALASFYGGGPRAYELNARTANGERFNKWGLTAAHRTLPFGTLLNVCFTRCVVVRVNDRGPARWLRRDIDLSRGAAEAIGLIAKGVGRVDVSILN